MTHEQMLAGLRDLKLAMLAKGMDARSPCFTLDADDGVPQMTCSIYLSWRGNYIDGRLTRIVYGATPEAALAAAANWVNGVCLWTPENVARTLGVEAA